MKLAIFFPFLALLATAAMPDVTFHKDVMPVLQKHCQICHRPGEAGPMSFLSYKESRPWAKAMRDAVASKKMPPWFADPAHGKFANDRRLDSKDIETLTQWANTGAKEGNPKDAPKPVTFAQGWTIGNPDVVFEMPFEFDIPAKGTLEYQHFVLPTNFKEDTWVTAVEVRPSNRAVTHHGVAFVRPPGSNWLRDAKPGVAYVPPVTWRSNLSQLEEVFETYVPGAVPHHLAPGQAKLIPAGSDIILQMHYTANGTASKDRSRIGLILSKTPPSERVYSMSVTNSKFAIPPGASEYPVEGKFIFQQEVKLLALSPHMHLRGKSMQYTVVYPTGESQVVLNVPNYDFSWQLFYYMDKPLVLPKGSRIDVRATFDNSANNKNNPDATQEVKWGDQSWQEMMVAFVDVVIPANMNQLEIYTGPKRQPKPAE